ncbi:radical SAM protein, partial [Candidatus Woesearchaeota archaeon]|nr:radical SAM protein [Candidatus Woesearchaeota archaeon]
KYLVPSKARIKLTRLCNLDCKMCYAKRNKEENSLSFDIIKKLLFQLKRFGVKTIILSGGEPLLRKDFEKIISEINKNNFKGVLMTNGTLLNNKICEILMKNDWEVSVSLDGHNRKINDEIRGEGSFTLIDKSLKNLIKNRDKYKSGRVVSNSVIQDINYKNLNDIATYITELGLNNFYFNFIAPLDKFKNKKQFLNLLSKNYYSSAVTNNIFNLDLVFDYLKIDKSHEKILDTFFKNNDVICFACDEILIDYDCNVYSCCSHLHQGKNIVGNIKHKDIEQIFYGEKFNNLRKEMLSLNSHLCHGCEMIFKYNSISKYIHKR